MQLCLQLSSQCPGGALRPPASRTSIWLAVPGLREAAPQAEGLRRGTWRPGSRRTPRVGAGPGRQRCGAAERQPAGRGATPRGERAGHGPRGSGDRGRGARQGREAGRSSRTGALPPARGRSQGGTWVLPLGRARVRRTPSGHGEQQRHREPGFRPLQPRHPSPGVCIALLRRGLCPAHRQPKRGFAAPGASDAAEVTGATAAFSHCPWLPRAGRAGVAVRVRGGALRMGELPAPVPPALQHAPGLSAALLPLGRHAG